MGQGVEQGGGHLGVAKDCGPFDEAKVDGDGNACFLVRIVWQMERWRAARITEWHASQFMQDHKIELG